MGAKIFMLFQLCVCASCNTGELPANKEDTTVGQMVLPRKDENPYRTIGDVPLPAGFKRKKMKDNSFSNWLQRVELKRSKLVYLYNGKLKANQQAQFAILNISVSNRNLQQCADAVMRLRAEYLFSEGRFESIIFKDNESNAYKFNAPHTRRNFDLYLQRVFSMCGSASLSKELNSIPFAMIAPGDVFIRGGFPGHAVIVMDVAENEDGKKIYLLAQSYMPAQDIHVLVNPANKSISPWYEVNKSPVIQTPEYSFTTEELKRW